MYLEPITDEFVAKMKTNKSTLFLYPLLFFHNSIPDPIGTYMGFQDYPIHKNMNLVCLYHIDNPRMKEIARVYKEHPKFYKTFFERDYVYFIMDFSPFPHTYKCIETGKYSQIKENVKQSILIQKDADFIHFVGLRPEEYHANVAEEFGISLEEVIAKKEILEAPNKENEYIYLPKKFLDKVL
jgi:hypothetical protein